MTPIPRDEARAAAERIVWQESAWPHQWIGQHGAHRGGIRCNDKADAVAFMERLCREHGCEWLSDPAPLPAVPSTPPAPGAWDDDTVERVARALALFIRGGDTHHPPWPESSHLQRHYLNQARVALAALHPTEEIPDATPPRDLWGSRSPNSGMSEEVKRQGGLFRGTRRRG